ncbi:MAG: hypothetical protein M1495_06850 [Bacteroidetes bacterium]|nr:hypothetical protein [Bacteroidota bacterium]
MNVKKLIIAFVVVFILLEATNYLVNMVILSSTYANPDISKIFRPMAEMESKMWMMWIADLVYSFFFVFIFVKGYESKGIMEGVRYGIYIGLFIQLLAAVAQNVFYPVPGYLAVQWFIYGLIQSVIFGVAAAMIYKPKAAA